MAYGRVEETFWSDSKIRRLPEDARTAMLYLLTCPHRNRLGCFVLRTYYAAGDLQWEPARVEAAFRELEEADRIRTDPETGLLLLPRYLRHNTLENSKVVKAAVGQLAALPASPLLEDLLDAVENFGRDHYRELLEALRARVGVRRSTTPQTNQQETNDEMVSHTVPRTVCDTPRFRLRQRLGLQDVEKEQPGKVESPEPIHDAPEAEPGPMDRLTAWLEDPAAVQAAIELAGDHPDRWALAFLGTYGPDGTEERLLAALQGPRTRRKAVGTALLAYLSEGHDWNARLFRAFLRSRIQESVQKPIPGTEAALVRTRPEPGPTTPTRVRLSAREGGGLVPVADLLPTVREA